MAVLISLGGGLRPDIPNIPNYKIMDSTQKTSSLELENDFLSFMFQGRSVLQVLVDRHGEVEGYSLYHESLKRLNKIINSWGED